MVSITFDLPKYKKVVLNALINLNERAGRAWIDAAIRQTPIPVWSGASRATFQRLAQSLGTSIPMDPIVAPESRVSLGRASSAGSGVVKDAGKPYVGFVYSTNLRYLAYNEYNQAIKGPYPRPWSNNVRFTPYFFQQRALTDWQKVAATAKLPDIRNYIKTGPL
jgi:hypothetical protein